MHQVHREITSWLEPLQAQVRVDAIGNLRALYPGKDRSMPRLLIGSHLDTVPNAGAFDGILGVILGVALIESLHGERLPFSIEVVGFSEEEGVRFKTPFIGSRALVGRVDSSLLELLDPQGVSVRKAIEDFGLKPEDIPAAAIASDVSTYLEFHIEQGPVLENMGWPLAAVEAIAGQSRGEITFTGRANHAGTTPMAMRSDALAAAAEWIMTVESMAKNVPGLVATVGSVEARPGAVNIIAGDVRASLDVRHRDDAVRRRGLRDLVHRAEDIARRRGLSVSWAARLDQPAVAMDSFLCGEIEKAIRKIGCEPHRMVSGAGHDAMIMAEKVPSAMIFLRTPGGVSHDPAESVAVEDVAKAIECGRQLLDQLATSSAFQTGTCRA